MNEFKRGSIWLTKSRNEINVSSLPYGSKPIIIVSNNQLNDKGRISYVIISSRRIETDTRLKLQIDKNGSIDHIFVETKEVFSIDSKYLCCYQGDLGSLELVRLTNKIAQNFGIETKSLNYSSASEIGNRILASKSYSNRIEEIKKTKKKVSDLTQEQKQYIFDNYSKSTRDSIAEMFEIYPYERVTNMANYLRTKFKTMGHL